MDQRELVLYTRGRSLRCWRAKRLLARRGYHVQVIDTTNGGVPGLLKQLTQSSVYSQTVPYLFVDRRPVGGFGIIRTLDGSGTLEHLVRGKV